MAEGNESAFYISILLKESHLGIHKNIPTETYINNKSFHDALRLQ